MNNYYCIGFLVVFHHVILLSYSVALVLTICRGQFYLFLILLMKEKNWPRNGTKQYIMYWTLNVPSVFISSDQTNPLQVDPLRLRGLSFSNVQKVMKGLK